MSAIGDLSGNVAVPMKTSVSDPTRTLAMSLSLRVEVFNAFVDLLLNCCNTYVERFGGEYYFRAIQYPLVKPPICYQINDNGMAFRTDSLDK